MLSLIAACTDPEENQENPDLRVVNHFNGYKISNIIVNGQSFRDIDEFILPGGSTEYLKVHASESLLLAYRWVNVNDTSDHDDYSCWTPIGEYPELKLNERYTLTYSGDKEEPVISVTQP